MKNNEKVTQSTAMEYRRRICLAMNFICNNLEKDLPLDEIARSASFSMFHFHRIFKAVVGETVAEFTRRLRLEQAANKLLMNWDSPVTDIALDCGFSSSQNFAKAFRNGFGMSPTAYRNSKQGNIFRKGENALSPHLGYTLDSLLPVVKESTQEGGMNMHAEIREMPEYLVAYVRRLGPYGKETCRLAFDELSRWAGPRGHLEKGTVLGVYWDNPEVTPPEKCRIDACVSVDKGTLTEGQIGLQVLAGGLYAVCRFEIDTEQFPQAWEEAFAWLINKGYMCDDRPCYELYHNNADEHPDGKWLADICIPLK